MSKCDYQKNATVFYAPVWVDDYSGFTASLSKSDFFEPIDTKDKPQYLLPYAAKIYSDPERCSVFRVKDEHLPSMCMFGKYCNHSVSPVMESVRITCFGTGCAFVEMLVTYDGMTITQIADFSFCFKNAVRSDKSEEITDSMYDLLSELFPASCKPELFFTGNGFKKECRMFHRIYMEDISDKDAVYSHLRHLARGYHNNFLMPKQDSKYDMLYQPYEYDFWAGSQEGLVNIFGLSGDKRTDYFLKNYKRDHLNFNYNFMYLLLLNQRFTAIKLIDDISRYNKCKFEEIEHLASRISELKTVYAFNVISDDQLYQNVYMRMYSLLDIDRLLGDVRDNESQVETIYSKEKLKNEKLTSGFLLLLSILSIFSVLTDAAGYFDRISSLQELSTVLSLVCTVGIVLVLFLIMWIRYKRK